MAKAHLVDADDRFAVYNSPEEALLQYAHDAEVMGYVDPGRRVEMADGTPLSKANHNAARKAYRKVQEDLRKPKPDPYLEAMKGVTNA